MYQSFGEWLRLNYPDYVTSVTVSAAEREAEKRLIADCPGLQLEMPLRSYARYGYTLSNFYAQSFAKAAGALDLGFHARLTNCGMAAIDTVIRALHLVPDSHIVAGRVLYPEVPKLFADLENYSISTHYIDSRSSEEILKACEEFHPSVLFFETVGNGPEMPVLDVEALLRYCWNRSVIVVLDNTFLTLALLNVFKIYRDIREDRGEPKMCLVYVESLSKHYRCGMADLVTAGIIIASQWFIAECDEVVRRTGTYLQFPCLEKLPADPLPVCSRMMTALSQNAKAVAEFLRKHPKADQVSYPDNHPQLKNGAGGVLFFEIRDVQNEYETGRRMERAFGPYKGSFGHPVTTWVPFQKADPTLPPGLVRLAVGWDETPDQIQEKLSRALA